ncbi:MAG TPA: PKD domain-containing protein [Thermoplasmata archaeon]|nr:PKD domain-containing protein [Thermoplasmata archaeon]
MGSRRTYLALRRRAAIALAVWAVAFAMLAVAAAIPEGPTAALTVDDAYPAVGQLVHFNASASSAHDAGNGRIVAYRFTFGDGQGTEWQPSPLADHAYGAAGTFVAAVTVEDNRGATGAASVTVHPGVPPPPPAQAPDLVPIQGFMSPTAPQVNDSVNVTVVVLNRGGARADAADVVVYDVPPNGTAVEVGTVALPGPVAPSATASARVGPFAAVTAGNHTLRIVVANVTPPETDLTDNELDLRVSVLAPSAPSKPGGGAGPGPAVSPAAVVLAAAAAASALGAGYFLLRPSSKGPLEPPPATPPDRSPPPIWPPGPGGQ